LNLGFWIGERERLRAWTAGIQDGSEALIRNLKSEMKFDIITIFPGFFAEVFEYGIVRRARAAGLVQVTAHDLRSWTSDKHRIVDDRPFGGGDGMVLKPEPIFDAVENLTGARERTELQEGTRVLLLSPQGRTLTQALAEDLARAGQIVLICGRYEGVDERVSEALVTDEISIGDYVLSGGEAAAIVLVDAVTRLLPGALGSETSARHDSFSEGLLDFPHYTRPPEFRGLRVPGVLLGGHHGEIERWRRRQALRKTRRNRPDLFANLELDERERAALLDETEEE
jgi:tRNA (guanine37-N1)-methyltransferase